MRRNDPAVPETDAGYGSSQFSDGTTEDPDPTTCPCGRCEEPISTDVDLCPICGYRPAGWNPRLTRVGEVAFALLLLAAVSTFAVGVAGAVLDVPVGPFSELAIVTPYLSGFSGFFVYYLHEKRQRTPTDDRVFR
jgi:hypothetical protein